MKNDVCRSPAVRAHPTEMWNWSNFDKIVGVPWDPAGNLKDEEGQGPTEKMSDIPKAFERVPEVRVEVVPDV